MITISNLISRIPGGAAQGIIWGIMALGVYVTFRVLKESDLSVDGSFATGGAVAVMLITGGKNPWLAVVLAFICGVVVGCCTGLIHTRLKIPAILSGILVQFGLYSINLMVLGGSPNLSLVRTPTIFKMIPFLTKNQAMTVIPIVAACLATFLIILLFHTHIGMCIRAVGDNEDMVRASSINVNACKIIAFSISNSLIALSGALIAQYQGYADISSSTGILVVGLASVIIGEAIFGKRGVTPGFISAVVGSLIYRYMIALATRYSPLDAYMLKLVSALVVGVTLAIPAIKENIALSRLKRGGKDHA